ncbi:arylamine N-acetyltransferase family protein [Umezawaea tangerina]|uniref:N-hydroxyarylamine O-acetyltransferase n=1 Tax=Umezawaea tangerina TaxID=84725 RepID=A0A2T0THJ5_9PSEU|nr:arylamine N-acetyltransferase [Umezawaea tangerina]PRY45081.1 N-hydroxyarylamine O-acetyltransferase [Umezawaea tangerina]
MTTHAYAHATTTLEVDTYLERIGYRGDLTPSAGTLRALHRAHLATVPFENLDVHLDAVVPLDRAAILDKVVARRRGGYCYELNTAFGALLEALGFDVTLACAAIGPRDAEQPLWGNHVALLVRVDGGTWVADVGLGQGFVEPLPLCVGRYERAGFEFEVARDDEWWVGLHRFGRLPGYLLREEPRTLEWFEPHHQRQSTDPESSFVRRLVVQRPHDGYVLTVVGAKLYSNGPDGEREVGLGTVEDFAGVLEGFGVPVGAVDVGRLYRVACG